MNSRSIRFRLIAWFAGLLILVTLAFGGYTYIGLERFLIEVLRGTLEHRADQISSIVRAIPKSGESSIGAAIEARFAPGRNDKFVRVTRADGSLLYLSEEPADRSFDPGEVPLAAPAAVLRHPNRVDLITLPGRSDLLIATQWTSPSSGGDRVEVGASLGGSYRVLHALLLTLAAGLPVVVGLAVLGGFVLIKRALAPVQNIMRAAQDITLRHLSRRLPVPASGDEIASLSLVLNQMIARLDESFQNTSRFTADASHELRTPLTIIRGELEALLLRRDLDPKLRDELSSLLEEVERLVRIVERLFALSRLDTGEAQTELVRLDLAGLAETTAEQMCLLAEEKHISLACESRERIEVEGDRSRLKQVIVNLLDNAIKYTPEHGRISLRVRAQNGSAFLEVSDSGPGVSTAALPHLFERFYRADEVHSRNTDGAGLGLSIVRSICSAHGGSISAANTPPRGCRFTVELPIAQKR